MSILTMMKKRIKMKTVQSTFLVSRLTFHSSGFQNQYFVAPGSPSYDAGKQDGKQESDDDDPLDAFMQGIDQEFQKDLKKAERNAETAKDVEKDKKRNKDIRGDIDEEDDEESYYRFEICPLGVEKLREAFLLGRGYSRQPSRNFFEKKMLKNLEKWDKHIDEEKKKKNKMA